MAEKNLVEEALIQIQNLEEAINENAKEILHSTMKEEISELVKESMKNEAEEDEFEVEDELEFEDSEEEENEFESEDEESEEEEDEFGTEEDEDSEEEFDMTDLSDMGGEDEFNSMEVTDLTDSSMEDVLKAFKQMSADDSFEIKKEGDFIHLKDEEDEYLIQTESEQEEYEGWESEEEEEELDEIVYEIEMNEEEEEEELDEMWGSKKGEYSREHGHEDGDGLDYEEDEYELEEEVFTESTKAVVGKGVKLGNAKTAGVVKKTQGGFNEKKAHANPTKGTGKPKFEFKEEASMDTDRPKKFGTKEEAKEAARTYGFGSKKGRGLRKGITPNRNLTFESREIMEEVEMLRAKNEEYRKALNMFRDKLNEVAVFNSNLAYATRLFTEHSTSKQEKINILRRFDTADTLKESKALYKTIKDELGGATTKAPMTESIERVMDKVPQSGSAVNLIESKTYENPQFLRMKDIMSKIIK
jgi:hypothetical protein